MFFMLVNTKLVKVEYKVNTVNHVDVGRVKT